MKLTDVKIPDLPLSTIRDVAAYIKVSVPTVYRLIKEKKLKAMNFPRTGKRSCLGVRPEDLQEYYDSFSRPPKRD